MNVLSAQCGKPCSSHKHDLREAATAWVEAVTYPYCQKWHWLARANGFSQPEAGYQMMGVCEIRTNQLGLQLQ